MPTDCVENRTPHVDHEPDPTDDMDTVQTAHAVNPVTTAAYNYANSAGIHIARDWNELTTRLVTSPSSSQVQIAFAPNGCFAMSPLYMNGFMSTAQSCSNHEKRHDFEKCVTHSYSEFPVTDNLNEMLQLLIAPSKTSAVFYRGFYVLLPKLMYALLGTFGAKLSSDSAFAAVVSSSLGSTSAVSQSASSADVSSSSEFDSVGASSSRAC